MQENKPLTKNQAIAYTACRLMDHQVNDASATADQAIYIVERMKRANNDISMQDIRDAVLIVETEYKES